MGVVPSWGSVGWVGEDGSGPPTGHPEQSSLLWTPSLYLRCRHWTTGFLCILSSFKTNWGSQNPPPSPAARLGPRGSLPLLPFPLSPGSGTGKLVTDQKSGCFVLSFITPSLPEAGVLLRRAAACADDPPGRGKKSALRDRKGNHHGSSDRPGESAGWSQANSPARVCGLKPHFLYCTVLHIPERV